MLSFTVSYKFDCVATVATCISTFNRFINNSFFFVFHISIYIKPIFVTMTYNLYFPIVAVGLDKITVKLLMITPVV